MDNGYLIQSADLSSKCPEMKIYFELDFNSPKIKIKTLQW